MGLLDFMNDPQMAGAMGLLSASGPSRTPVSLGQALGAGYQAQQQALDSQQQRQFGQMKMDAMKSQMAQQKAAKEQRDAFRKTLPPEFQNIPDELLDEYLKQSMKPKEPKRYVVGGNLVDESGANYFTAPEKPESVPSQIKEYEYAQKQGYKGSYQDFQTELRRAGASNTSVTYGAPVAGIGKDGNPVFFQPSKNGGDPAIVPGVKPADAVKPPTEFEAKAGLYFKSMQQATQTLSEIEKNGNPVVQPSEVLAGGETVAGNVVRSKERQQYVQAQRQWIDSINRVRSGANLPEMEYGRAVKTFFPEFGDSPQTIKQKAIARAQEETAMSAAAGKALPKSQNNVRKYNPATGRIE